MATGSLPPTEEELKRFHKFFGVEANNRCWVLIETPELSSEELFEVLDLAHVAAHHWKYVGTELHNMRATMLLTMAYFRNGNAHLARKYADLCCPFFADDNHYETPDWETAMTNIVIAAVAKLEGNSKQYEDFKNLAIAQTNALPNEIDKEIVTRSLELIL